MAQGFGNQDGTMPRGFTAYNGDTIDSNNLRFGPQLGQIRVFADINVNSQRNEQQLLTNLPVTCIFLRNKHNAALLPKQAVKLSGTVIGETGAPIAAVTDLFVIVDEYLPAAGCPVNDCFWGVIGGPTTALFETFSGAQAAGQLLVIPSTTSGKLKLADTTPDDDAEAQNQAVYGTAWTMGAIADAATEARIIITKSFFG